MDEMFEFNTLLVPTDFSAMSRATFEQALRLATGDDATVIVLHVLDSSLAEFVAKHELASRDNVIRQMRARAEQKMSEYTSRAGAPVTIKAMISDGIPFLEIIDKARELLVDAVVIGKVGGRGALEKLLFGSTAEKVIRGCSRPVIVLPIDAEPQ